MAPSEATRTLILVNLASIMEKADEALLPAVYKEVGAALHTNPIGLGSLTLFRSFVQAAFYPLAAYLAVRHNRCRVIAAGAFLWSAATFLVAVSSSFSQVAVARGLNGVGLALVTPAIQSLVADSTDDSTRGSAFGYLQLTSNLGSLLGGFFGLLLSSTTVFSIQGWRVAFHLTALISILVGTLIYIYARDPLFSQTSKKSVKQEIQDLIRESKRVMKIRSFQILIAQGVTGSFPWSALSFAPMWLELIGFSHVKTAVLMATFAVSSSLGGVVGGKLGDYLSVKFPNKGRIVLSQISSGSAIPLAAVLLLGLGSEKDSGLSRGVVMFVMGLSISWNAPATNNPIFAEIVPEKSRTSIYALDRSFESVLASFAPPIVGFLAQHVYGFRPPSKSGNSNPERENAVSLAKALYACIAVPMAMCCVIYAGLYGSYKRDRERARMDGVVDEELRRLELEDKDGVSVIDLEFEDDGEDASDDDEKLLVR
ncbi:hypothetical protein LUZ60_003030 [Juncus effusus]|nr:hypothetical protein LUZ60_003030 [Juncus effusus]